MTVSAADSVRNHVRKNALRREFPVVLTEVIVCGADCARRYVLWGRLLKESDDLIK